MYMIDNAHKGLKDGQIKRGKLRSQVNLQTCQIWLNARSTVGQKNISHSFRVEDSILGSNNSYRLGGR